MSEMRERIHEFQAALRRYLKNNDLEEAGAPLIGALYDLTKELCQLNLPVIVGRFEILPGARAQFFQDIWEHEVVSEDKMQILLFSDKKFPHACINKNSGKLFLEIRGYGEQMEQKLMLLRRGDTYLKPAPRKYDEGKNESLHLYGQDTIAELLENYK